MPPGEKFSREAVAKAAFALVRRRGPGALTARNIATRLKSSTAPVYQQFSSMDKLRQEVMDRAEALMLEYMTRPYSEMPFLNMGVGYTAFAREEPELFRTLFLERDKFRGKTGDMLDTFSERMAGDERLAGLDKHQRLALLQKMWTYTHGLATMIWAGIIVENSDEEIKNKLIEMGGLAIEAALGAADQQ